MEQKVRLRRSSNRERQRALALATAAPHGLTTGSRSRGRVWVNGREVGGADSRFDHLGRSHD